MASTDMLSKDSRHSTPMMRRKIVISERRIRRILCL